MIFEKVVVNAYKKMTFARCDDNETVLYFSADDFPGLKKEPYSFASSLGHILLGYVYSYDGARNDRLIIFEHGLGSGHGAYMQEIEKLCKEGYIVLAYDHTGCMESGGKSTGGLAQSLRDLDDCITSVKFSGRFAGVSIAVMGHSWGAFATLNITVLHPDITHIVAMCGFVSVTEMINSLFSGALKWYKKPILALEREANPGFFEYNAVHSLSASDVKALLIYSDNDTLCKRMHYDILKAGLSDKENVDFLLVSGKGHNPNYTVAAASYVASFGKLRAKLLKKKKLTAEDKRKFVESFDFGKMTEQDGDVWKKIFAHLSKQTDFANKK